jgi:hypothetical protein
MSSRKRAEASAERGVLGALALVCYAVAVTAMLAFGYTTLALALRALGPDFAFLLSPAGV